MRLSQISKLIIVSAFLTFFLSACSGGGSQSASGDTAAVVPDQPINQTGSLLIDQMSPIPLINGNSQTFYVYVSNVGQSDVSGLTWSLVTPQEASTNSAKTQNSIVAKIKSLFNINKATDQETSKTLSIVDQSQCNTIMKGQNCRITMLANGPSVLVLSATKDGKSMPLSGGHGLLAADYYTTNNSNDLANTLTLSTLSSINFANGAVLNSYVINNSSNPVTLTSKSLGNLPANVSVQLGNCPIPLPSSYACQVRLIFTNPSKDNNQKFNIPTSLAGNMINNDGSNITLPTQNGNVVITATNSNTGNLQTITSQHVTVDASSGTPSNVSALGFISNNGNGPLLINSITVASNDTSLSISNNNCNNKTLQVDEICTYTTNLNVSAISSNGSSSTLISYSTNGGATSQTQASTIAWTYIPPVANPLPSISLTTTPHDLNQSTESALLTITNNGNVTLTNLSAITLSNPRLIVTNTTCVGNLAVNSSCNYALEYIPSPPSETAAVIISGISASYLDLSGTSKNITFSNSTALNLSSHFAGVLLIESGTISLTQSNPTSKITITNVGNLDATNISFQLESTNNIILGGSTTTCTTTLAPKQSCTVGVKLQDTITNGAANNYLTVSYKDNTVLNNTISSSIQITSIVGSATSLQVTVANSNLVTSIGQTVSTTITLTNNGSYNLNNIILPTPPQFLSITPVTCGQSLNIGNSCTLTLTYTPTTPQYQEIIPIGPFSAIGQTPYFTDIQITLSSVQEGPLSISPASLVANIDWANSSFTNSVSVQNNNPYSITIESISALSPGISVSGCQGEVTLSPDQNCILNISGNYVASTNTAVNITYKTSPLSQTKTVALPITVNYTSQPVVTPNLQLTSNLFNSTVNQGIDLVSPAYYVTLSNKSTVSNSAGDATITVQASPNNLVPAPNQFATYHTDTIGIAPGNACNSGSMITLRQNESCSYNLYVTTTSTPSTGNLNQDLNVNYMYYKYPANLPIQTPITTTKNFTLNSNQPTTQLAVSIASENTGNEFNGIQQNSLSPTMNLLIKNMGATTTVSNIIPNLPAAIQIMDLASCFNLAPQASCTIKLQMQTQTVISGNLGSSTISYPGLSGLTSTSLPNIIYSVIPESAPTFSMTASVIGACAVGNGTPSTCYNNPGAAAASIQLKLNFTNTSNTVATNLRLSGQSVAEITSKYPNFVSNNCAAVIQPHSSCTIPGLKI